MEVRYNIRVWVQYSIAQTLSDYIPFIKSVGNENAIANTGESFRPSHIFGAWKSDVWIRRYNAFESASDYNM